MIEAQKKKYEDFDMKKILNAITHAPLFVDRKKQDFDGFVEQFDEEMEAYDLSLREKNVVFQNVINDKKYSKLMCKRSKDRLWDEGKWIDQDWQTNIDRIKNDIDLKSSDSETWQSCDSEFEYFRFVDGIIMKPKRDAEGVERIVNFDGVRLAKLGKKFEKFSDDLMNLGRFIKRFEKHAEKYVLNKKEKNILFFECIKSKKFMDYVGNPKFKIHEWASWINSDWEQTKSVVERTLEQEEPETTESESSSDDEDSNPKANQGSEGENAERDIDYNEVVVNERFFECFTVDSKQEFETFIGKFESKARLLKLTNETANVILHNCIKIPYYHQCCRAMHNREGEVWYREDWSKMVEEAKAIMKPFKRSTGQKPNQEPDFQKLKKLHFAFEKFTNDAHDLEAFIGNFETRAEAYELNEAEMNILLHNCIFTENYRKEAYGGSLTVHGLKRIKDASWKDTVENIKDIIWQRTQQPEKPRDGDLKKILNLVQKFPKFKNDFEDLEAFLNEFEGKALAHNLNQEEKNILLHNCITSDNFIKSYCGGTLTTEGFKEMAQRDWSDTVEKIKSIIWQPTWKSPYQMKREPHGLHDNNALLIKQEIMEAMKEKMNKV